VQTSTCSAVGSWPHSEHQRRENNNQRVASCWPLPAMLADLSRSGVPGLASHNLRAIATVAEGVCELCRTGRLNGLVRISPPDSDFDVAVFQGKWDGPGTLTFRDGRAYCRENTNWSHMSWVWTGGSTSKPVIHVKGHTRSIVPDAAPLSDVALMGCLSWYLRVLQVERLQGAALTAAVSISQSVLGSP